MGQHWKKEERRSKLVKLLSIITQLGEANYSILLQKMQPISEPILSECISALEHDGKIEHFSKTHDRREKWYRINAEKSKLVYAEIGKNGAFQFIENFLENSDKITFDGKEPDWIRRGYTWIDESGPEPLYFSVTVERKKPEIFLKLNPHLRGKT